jgi:peroxiredoxin
MRHAPGRRVALASLLVALALSAASPALAAGRDLTGYPAPEIHVVQGINGLPTGIELAQLRGRVVVLKFWFTSCGPCRASMVEFQALHDRYARQGVWFVAIASDERPPAEAFIRSKGYTFPVGIDPQGVSADRFGVYSFPTNYVVGTDGTVRSYGRIDASVIEREIERMPPSARAGGYEPRPPRTASPRAATPASVPPRATPPAGTATALSRGERNVRELGEVPPALSEAREAARRNDYGAVLRVAARARPGTADAAAAERMRAIALRRFENRVRHAQDLWSRADYAGSYAEALAIARDFRGTERATWAATWVARFEETPTVRALRRTSTVASRR